RVLIDRNYDRAETLPKENMSILHAMADALMEWETIDRLQIDDLMEGRKPRPPKDLDEPKTATSSTGASEAEESPVSADPVPGNVSCRTSEDDGGSNAPVA
ncbi:MAG: ATP-dependent metalloprotease, partial [Methylococcus sp.]